MGGGVCTASLLLPPLDAEADLPCHPGVLHFSVYSALSVVCPSDLFGLDGLAEDQQPSY
jgi:hypothetical protein